MQRVAILSQDHVDRPAAVRGVEAGVDVVGFDVGPQRVARLAGRSYIDDIGDVDLAAVKSRHLCPSSDEDNVGGFDVTVVSAPSPLRDHAPPRAVDRASRLRAWPRVRNGCSVVLESTTAPSTSEELFVPRFEPSSRLSAGTDFAVGW